MSEKLQGVLDKINSFENISDATQINKLFPILEDE